MDEVDPVTKADACVYFGGLGSLEAEVRGHGFAELIGTIIRAVTLRDRKWNYERVHKAYLKAYDMPKYLEVYGEEEENDEKKEEEMAAADEEAGPDSKEAAPAEGEERR